MRRLEDFPVGLPYKRYRHPVWDFLSSKIRVCVGGVWGVCVTGLFRGLGTCRGQRTTDRSWFLLPCGSRDQTQVTNLGSQCPYWLRSLTHPMGSVRVTFIVVAVVKFLQCETTFYCQSEFCVSLLIFNPQLHFSD